MPHYDGPNPATPAVTAGSFDRRLYLNGWRGLCIIFVLLGHFSPVHFFDIAALGVEMFFVLSGRLMADILFIRKSPLVPFYVRRFSRVWPGVFAYTAFCAALFYSVPGFLHVSLAAIIGALTFTTNYKIALFGQTQLLDHTWSLGVSESTYVLLGILSYAFRNRSPGAARLAVLVCAALAVCNGLLQTHFIHPRISATDFIHNFYLYGDSDIRCASILMSVFLYLHLKAHDIRIAAPTIVTLGSFLFGALLFFKVIPPQISYTLGTICLAFVLASLETHGNKFRKIFGARVLVLFGSYSFSIYVWQQLFYKSFQDLRTEGILSPLQGLELRPLFVLGACAAGVLSFYLVENPARRFINDKWASPARRHAGAEPSTVPPDAIETIGTVL